MTPVPMTGRDRTLTGLKRSPADRFFPMADPFFPMTEQFSPAYSHTLSFRVHPRHVYVHVPFCARRCVYCDFAIAVRRHVPVDDYVSAIERELSIRFPERGAWQVETLYFGGGTPSRLGGDGVSRLLDVLQERITIAPHAEVTLEANPEDASLDAVRAWRAAGINRLSLGGQSFDD